MQAKLRCYVASPLGFSEAGRHYYAEVLLPALSKLIEPVDPWDLVSEQEITAALNVGREEGLTAEIGRRNIDALKSCKLLVAILDGQELDSGTAAEIGYASALGIVCLGLRTDARRSGEFGARINLQVEAFLVGSGGVLTDSLEALLVALAEAAQAVGQS
ncbi:MAG TPA: nucleoside 2-deoxyribosyltransferase [Solirubrobacterales bacterium]|nr:nucleoside 2-deoxyribosyltransferase [Solirubrobacterales bacterium]